MAKRPKPIVLTVLDGWGYRAESQGNAIALARKPTYDSLIKNFPNTVIHTSGPSVGLPEGQMGNSEVGHLNIGAGRIVHMDMTRIDLLVAQKAMGNVPLFKQAMERGRQRSLHLLGLISDGGVHSHLNHLYALLEVAAQERVQNVFVHCFMDGRDTPPHNGREYLQQLQRKMRELGTGQIATINGRYYAMDRDNRWEREEIAYRAMVHGEAETRTDDPDAAMQRSYEQGVTDEFVKPVVITKGVWADAPPVGLIRDDDAVIFFNYRADRAREMTMALVATELRQICRCEAAEESFLRRDDAVRQIVAVAQLCDRAGKTRAHPGAGFCRRAVQKFALRGDRRNTRTLHISSTAASRSRSTAKSACWCRRRKSPTYDLKPEMSAEGITDTVVKAIERVDRSTRSS